MSEYMQRIACDRPGFELIGLGSTIWQLGMHGSFFRRTVANPTDFWYSDFGEPFRLSRFDPLFLPNYMIEVVDQS